VFFEQTHRGLIEEDSDSRKDRWTRGGWGADEASHQTRRKVDKRRGVGEKTR